MPVLWNSASWLPKLLMAEQDDPNYTPRLPVPSLRNSPSCRRGRYHYTVISMPRALWALGEGQKKTSQDVYPALLGEAQMGESSKQKVHCGSHRENTPFDERK